MRRPSGLAAFLATASLVAGSTVDAIAHGGQFRGPTPTNPTSPGGWWDLNLDALIAESPSEGPVVTGASADLERVRQVAREKRIVPFLRGVVAGSQGPDADLISAAALALGKTTSEPADVERLLALSKDTTRPDLILEAAALAPGLLRRSNPALQFDARLLDRVRLRCLEIFDGATRGPRRVRCLAALAVGLLGDQPRPMADGGAPAVDVVAELFARLAVTRDAEEEIALVVALGLSPRAAYRADSLEALLALASNGSLGSRRRPLAVQAHAMMALARVTGPESSGVFLGFVRALHTSNELRHASLAAFGLLASQLDPAARVAAMTEISAHAEKGNPETVGLALLAIGRLGAAAMVDASDRSTLASAGAKLLIRQMEKGSAGTRRIAALATGVVLRPEPAIERDESRLAFRRDAVAALSVIVDEGGGDPELRGASAFALGLARDGSSLARLIGLVARRDIDVGLRARAATAIGLLGAPTTAALEILRLSIAPTAPDGVRREAARSLGLLGDASALPALVAVVRSDASDTERSRAAVSLGALRRTNAADVLIELASDRSAGDTARAIAVAALGLLGDPERIRSLSRLANDLSSGSIASDALGQALSLL